MTEKFDRGQQYEQEGKQLESLIRSTADVAITTTRFVCYGEVAPPLIPVKEADEVRNQYREAAAKLVSPLLTTLLHPAVVDFFREKKYFSGALYSSHISQGVLTIFTAPGVFRRQSEQDGCSAVVSFSLETETPKAVFKITTPSFSDSVRTKSVDEYFERFKKSTSETFPGENEWVFEHTYFTPPSWTSGSRSESVVATREFEPNDIGRYPDFLPRFLKGTKELLDVANTRIVGLTMEISEKERLDRVIDACNEAADKVLLEIKS